MFRKCRMADEFGPCPPRFADIKRDIAGAYPDFEQRVTRAWTEVLDELSKATEEIAAQGPEVRFSNSLRPGPGESGLDATYSVYRWWSLRSCRGWGRRSSRGLGGGGGSCSGGICSGGFCSEGSTKGFKDIVSRVREFQG